MLRLSQSLETARKKERKLTVCAPYHRRLYMKLGIIPWSEFNRLQTKNTISINTDFQPFSRNEKIGENWRKPQKLKKKIKEREKDQGAPLLKHFIAFRLR